jgi:phage protein U
MTEIMLALGEFRFSMDTAAYKSLSRERNYDWGSQSRIGRRPALQFMGVGSETITLSGIVYPHFRGGLGQVDAMAAEAGKGGPLQLVDGNGKFLGVFVITKVKEGQSFIDGSGTPYKQTFSLDLKAYGEDLS